MPPQRCVERKTATATEGSARYVAGVARIRRRPQTISKAEPHANYAVFTCARPPGDTVTIAQIVDSPRSRRAAAARREAGECFEVRRTLTWASCPLSLRSPREHRDRVRRRHPVLLSPCVLPLVAAFLVNMAGEAVLAGTQRTRTVAHALAFVVGFSVVFTLLWG